MVRGPGKLVLSDNHNIIYPPGFWKCIQIVFLEEIFLLEKIDKNCAIADLEAEAVFFFQKFTLVFFREVKNWMFLVIAVFGLSMHGLHIGARCIWACCQIMAIFALHPCPIFLHLVLITMNVYQCVALLWAQCSCFC